MSSPDGICLPQEKGLKEFRRGRWTLTWSSSSGLGNKIPAGSPDPNWEGGVQITLSEQVAQPGLALPGRW